jgi:hypothetical protein
MRFREGEARLRASMAKAQAAGHSLVKQAYTAAWVERAREILDMDRDR